MKYANIGWQEIFTGNRAAVNFGDNLQFLAIDYIYSKMEVKNVTYLDMSEVSSYKGEKLVLPLNWSLFDKNYMKGDFLDISKDIEPIFLGMTICSRDDKRFFNQKNIEYLNLHGPVGCRDEYTYQMLSQYGIQAYLNGCATIILPQREKKGKKVLLVDAPIELKAAIQEHLGIGYECMSQQVYLEEDEICNLREMAIEHYRYISENAAVVVTSRLHIVSPCIALGIPVIFARKKIDVRFGWIDKLIKLYAENEFSEINWLPDQVFLDDMKQMILENDMRRIRGNNVAVENEKISNFFCKRDHLEYCSFSKSLADVDKLIDYINREWNEKTEVRYVLWGLNRAAEEIYHYITEKFPLAEMVGIIDDYKNEVFAGRKCVTHDQIELDELCYVLVTAVAASNAVHDYFGERDRVFLLGDVFI